MSCETVESRLVLSAVSVVTPAELPQVAHTTNEDVESLRYLDTSDDSTQVVDQDAAVTPETDSIPMPMEGSEYGQPDTTPNFDMPRPDAVDAFFGNFDNSQGVRRRDPLLRPPVASSTGDDTTDNVFDNSDVSTQQVALADTEANPLTVEADSDENTDDEATTVSTDGFVQIPRVTEATSGLSALLRDNLNSQQAANGTKLDQGTLNSSSERQATTTAPDESALQAALAFFNQQTGGGFVDAELDELAAAGAISGASNKSASAAGLEAGLGRFNPFDDGSHTTMLTAVDLRHDAESNASQANNNDASTNLALVSLVVGSVGIGSSSSGKVFTSLRKFVQRMRSAVGLNETTKEF